MWYCWKGLWLVTHVMNLPRVPRPTHFYPTVTVLWIYPSSLMWHIDGKTCNYTCYTSPVMFPHLPTYGYFSKFCRDPSCETLLKRPLITYSYYAPSAVIYPTLPAREGSGGVHFYKFNRNISEISVEKPVTTNTCYAAHVLLPQELGLRFFGTRLYLFIWFCNRICYTVPYAVGTQFENS